MQYLKKSNQVALGNKVRMVLFADDLRNHHSNDCDKYLHVILIYIYSVTMLDRIKSCNEIAGFGFEGHLFSRYIRFDLFGLYNLVNSSEPYSNA